MLGYTTLVSHTQKLAPTIRVIIENSVILSSLADLFDDNSHVFCPPFLLSLHVAPSLVQSVT